MFNDWGAQKQREMFEIWQSHFSDHLSGFELFTSPLREDAAAVIIGYNAGGGERNATELDRNMDRFMSDHPDFSLPEKGQYEKGGYDYLIAKRMRRYFFREKTHLLSNAVETNRYFLRTEGKRHHKDLLNSVHQETRTKYEEFCRKTNRELILRSNPDVVFDFSGEYTADEFCEDLGFNYSHTGTHQPTDERDSQVTVDLAEMTENPGSTVISITPHPSARGLASEDLEFLANTIPPRLPEDSSSA